jgi:hypothetical protein
MRAFSIASGRHILRSIALAMFCAGAPAWAATTADPPSAQAQHADVRDTASDAVPLAWNKLDAAQQSMLAPIRSLWDQIPPQRQQHLAAHAEHWSQLPPDRLARIQQRLTHWAQMTPEQRRDARHGEDAFRSMSAADRQRVMDAYQKFKSLSPQERRALMQRFRQERGKGSDRRGRAPDASGSDASVNGQPPSS